MKVVPGNLLRQGNNCDIGQEPGRFPLFSLFDAMNDECQKKNRSIDIHHEDECNHHPNFLLLDCGDSPAILSVFYVAYASN